MNGQRSARPTASAQLQRSSQLVTDWCGDRRQPVAATPTVRAMAPELQRLVDHLGGRLKRSVAIDDPHIRLLAYTAHTGQVDDARIESIMQRSVPVDLIEYIKKQGAAQAEDLFTVQARSEIGLTIDRIGMPIRYDGSLLGYLWLVGSDGPVSDQDADAIREAATRAALILHGEHLASGIALSRGRELLRDLVSSDAQLRAEAADALIEEEFIVAGPVTALVVTLTHEQGEPLDQRGRHALDIAVDHGRRRLPPGHAVTLNRPDHSLLLAVWPATRAAPIEKSTSELADAVHERLTAEVGAPPAPMCWIGLGRSEKGLADAHSSYTQARRAADVARITGALGSTVSYAQLGVYALLAKLAPEELAEGIHPGIRQLIGPGSNHWDLGETLQAYLDNAGEVQRTADQLHIHRATLYYRLRRVEEFTGLDLAQGDDRLAAHLSLKLARLIRPD